MTTFKHIKSGHLDVGDGLVKLGTQQAITKDIGWVSQYADTADTAHPVKYTGFARSAADGIYRLFDGQISVATVGDPETLTLDSTLSTPQFDLGTLSASQKVLTNNLTFGDTSALANNEIVFPAASGLRFVTNDSTPISFIEIDPVNSQVRINSDLIASEVNLTISGISTAVSNNSQYSGNLSLEGSAISFNDTSVGHKNQIQFPSVSGFEIIASDSSYGIQFSNNTTDYAIPHTIAVSAANIELRGDTHQFSGFSLNVVTLTPAANSTTTLDGTSSIFRVDATAGATTLSLPDAAANAGRVYKIVKIDSSSNTATITPPTGQYIDQSTTSIVLDTQYDSVALVSDGYGWYAGL